MLWMSSHCFFWRGGTETKWSSCTVISSICCAVRAPIIAVSSYQEQQQIRLNSSFLILGFVAFKLLVPRDFISGPFYIFRVLFDHVMYLPVAWHLVIILTAVLQSIWNLIFLLLIIIHDKLSTAQECSTLLVLEEFLPKPVGCIFGNTNHCKTRADQLSQRKASKVSKNPQEPFISWLFKGIWHN